MHIAPSLIFAAILVGAALPSTAQQNDSAAASIEAAIARLVADSMPTERRPRARNWSEFDRRNSADVVWNVLPPNGPAAAPQDCGFRRTGWVPVRGASAEILACGDTQRIEALSFEVAGLWLGRTDVIEELEAHGVTAVLQHSTGAAPSPRGSRERRSNGHYQSLLSRHPASRRWRLERPEAEAATLTADWRCTRPGTRSATRCWMTWTLVFAPTGPLAGDAPEETSQEDSGQS